jgi:hypothetical protein
MKPIARLLPLALSLLSCGYPDQVPPRNANAERVAVLITGWGEPRGWDADFRRAISGVARIGELTRYPGQACTDGHVGRWPFASQIGLLPHAVAYKVPFLGGAWDSLGVYRLSDNGSEFVSILEDGVRVPVSFVPDEPGMITDMVNSPLLPDRSLGGRDPRNGANYLAGVYQVGAAARGRGSNPLAMPNGLSDAVELGFAASLLDAGFMYDNLTPRANEAEQAINRGAMETLRALFGDRVESRFGAYAATPGIHADQREVALDFVRRGFTRLVLARETTDNNRYANSFMTRGWVDKALCKAGYADDVAIKQTHQVGRTPEYNTALLEILRPHLESRPAGSEVAIVYTTYGMPFPGASDSGPFGQAHPLAREEFHENAYLNYQSFKRYAQDEFGASYRLQFNRGSRSGDLRTDSYYAYGMFPSRYYGAADDPLRFPTLREVIDSAKGEGRRDIVVLLSHWSYNNTDNLLAVRRLNGIPYNSREEMRRRQYWTRWCEVPGDPAPADCDADDAVRLSFSEAFDRQAAAFGVGYGQRIRGTVERFGLLPEGLDVIVKAPVSKVEGGSLRVEDGPLAGVRLEVAADPRPGLPENNTWDDYQVFVDPGRPFISAWFDFDAYAGTQRGLEAPADAVAAPVVLGPYRTIVNQPARVTLPYRGDPGALRAVIYNHVTGGWDPVFPVAGGRPAVQDRESRSFSFDTQVLGAFSLVPLPGPADLATVLVHNDPPSPERR